MTYILSYCHFTPKGVWLNGKQYFKAEPKPFVLHDFFSAVYKHAGINYRKFYKMDALSKLGFLASELLLAGSDREQPKPDMGILFFNSASSMDADRNFQQTIQNKDDFFPSPAEFVYTLPNIVTGEIAIRNKIYGETAFYVTRHFMSDVVEEIVEDAVSYAGLKCALVGWLHVDVAENTLEGMMMLCATGLNDTGKEKYVPEVSKGLEQVGHAEELRDFNGSHLYDLYEFL